MLLHEYANQVPESIEEETARICFENWYINSRCLPLEWNYKPFIDAITELAWQILQLQVCVEGILEDLDLGGECMDKKIKGLKKKIDKGMDTLIKADKPRDKKLKKCDEEMKKKK